MRDQQLAIIFLNKLDKKKYGAMLEDWDNRLNDGEDVYPKTLNEAFRRVSNRKCTENTPQSIRLTLII